MYGEIQEQLAKARAAEQDAARRRHEERESVLGLVKSDVQSGWLSPDSKVAVLGEEHTSAENGTHRDRYEIDITSRGKVDPNYTLVHDTDQY